MRRGVVLLIAAALAQGCRAPAPIPRTASTPNRVWSDAKLLDYVSQARGMARSGVSTAVLGVHRGLKLVQTVSCGDTGCGPDHVSRVVHYELPKSVDCAAAGGVVKSLRVEAGYASKVRQFCFPPVLVEHWPETAPQMSGLD